MDVFHNRTTMPVQESTKGAPADRVFRLGRWLITRMLGLLGLGVRHWATYLCCPETLLFLPTEPDQF